MLITLTRTGGFTGIPFKKTIDTSKLPTDEREKLENDLRGTMNELRTQVNSQSSIVNNQSDSPDRFTYYLSIQDQAGYNTEPDKKISQNITIPEEKLKETTGTLKSLLDLIEKT